MKNKLLASTGKELSSLLGAVLQPKPYKHTKPINDDSDSGYNICGKCGKRIFYVNWVGTGMTEEGKIFCTVPDPIPITPAEAFKWLLWANDNFTYSDIDCAIKRVVDHDDYNDFSVTICTDNDDYHNISSIEYWDVKYSPRKTLLAIALCVLSDKENKEND